MPQMKLSEAVTALNRTNQRTKVGVESLGREEGTMLAAKTENDRLQDVSG